MARSFWVLIFLAALTTLALIGSGDWSTRAHRIDGGVLSGGDYHAALPGEPANLDPAIATDATSVHLMIQMFDGLVCFAATQEGSVGPAIASTWTISKDHKVYTFTLRDDVRFHPIYAWTAVKPGEKPQPSKNRGRIVEAEDFRYSIERVLTKETGSPRTLLFEVLEGAREYMEGKAAHVSGIETPDRRTLRLRLLRPYAPFLKTLTMPNAAVVPREDVEALKKQFSTHPVGTGAFLFGGYKPAKPPAGQELRLLANPDYFLGRPRLHQVIFHVELNEDKRFQMFISGQLHHILVPDPYYSKVAERDGKWYPYKREEQRLGIYYYGMNVQRYPFDNPDVRRAFSFAIDREAIKKYIKIDSVDTAESPLPRVLKRWSVLDTKDPVAVNSLPIAFNQTRADELLTRAGYPLDAASGRRLTFPRLPLDIVEGEEHARIARAVQANLADVGIDTYVAIRPIHDHLELLRRGSSSLFRLAWVADYRDADSFLYLNFHSRNIGASNFCRYANPAVDRLLDEARVSGDNSVRDRLYREVEETIVRDAVWICLFNLKTTIVCQPTVRNLQLTEFGDHLIRYHDIGFGPVPSGFVQDPPQKPQP